MRKQELRIKELEKEKEISEDEMHRGRDEIKKITDQYMEKISRENESEGAFYTIF
jgi:ribosome recycling factor